MTQLQDQANTLNNEAADATAAQRKQAAKPWAACMAKAGYPQYHSPDGLSYPDGDPDSGELWPDPRPNAEEIAVAQASGRCMISTGYLEKVSKAKAIAAHKRIAKKPGLITEWKKLHDEEVKVAQSYAAGSGK
ncbi:MAG: hypothetical protein E7A79_07910 [Actinomycetaceae bacterium]|nr:hypothetical protein [Actinomycetaceae bacterium]